MRRLQANACTRNFRRLRVEERQGKRQDEVTNWSDKQKFSKTNKFLRKKAHQQQHLDKNDFSTWKVPLSQLASHKLGSTSPPSEELTSDLRNITMATAKKTPAKKVAAPAKKVAPAKKAAAPAKKAVAKKAPAKKAAPAKRTPNPAFMKALTPSPALAAVVGAAPLPRTEVVSKMWVYIKKNKLQDSVNRRAINADDKLKAVFGKPQVTMFEMAGLIGKHLK
jgi:upstream activation factor subunit UAF30